MLRVVEDAAKSDTGRQRNANEDVYLARSPVFVVADGMGGARAGEVAAQIAAEAFETQLPDGGTAQERLAHVAGEANRQIFERARADSSRSGMGTTLTGALVSDDEVAIVHVGDSRAYLLRDGQLRQLTRDHSLVEELRRRGQLTPEEAEDHPQRSIITRALGAEPHVDPDIQTHQARSGDVFLLCSDGLTTMVREERLHEILVSSGSLRAAVDRLVEEANRMGGRDNITAVLIRVGGEEEKPATGETAEDTRPDLDSRAVRDAVGPARATKRARAPRRRLRVAAITAAVIVLLAAGTVGALIGLKQVYFIGQDDRGLVTLYRGLPYDLPAGVKLYQKRYVSFVQLRRLRPFERRRLVNHKLRSHSDAAKVIRDLERR